MNLSYFNKISTEVSVEYRDATTENAITNPIRYRISRQSG